MKICKDCKRHLPYTDFRTRTQHGKPYIIAKCRKCEVTYNKLKADNERRRIQERKRFSNPVRKEQKNSFQRKWRAKNIEKNRAYHRKHIKKHVDEISDSYITRIFRVKKDEVSPELIDAYRTVLKVKRLLKQKAA